MPVAILGAAAHNGEFWWVSWMVCRVWSLNVWKTIELWNSFFKIMMHYAYRAISCMCYDLMSFIEMGSIFLQGTKALTRPHLVYVGYCYQIQHWMTKTLLIVLGVFRLLKLKLLEVNEKSKVMWSMPLVWLVSSATCATVWDQECIHSSSEIPKEIAHIIQK